MSMYVSYAPVLERTAAENAGGRFVPESPGRPARVRTLAAVVLRATARAQLGLAARLELPRRVAAA